MRKILLQRLGAALIYFMAGAAAAEAPAFDYATAAKEPAPEILSSIRKMQDVELLRGEFKQRKNLKILKQPFLSNGWFIFSRNDGLYWEITEPLPGAYLIGKKGIRPAAGSSGTSVDSPFADGVGRMFSSIMGARLEELESYFDIYYRSLGSRWQLGLKPRNSRIATFMSGIEITGGRYIDTIRIVEGGGDTTEITFTAVTEELPDGLASRYFNAQQ
ncbi:MAG TPA: outer membrane lipoprotein carrier protein LolA [Gammaproteobacteria bacterium]|nr:outer membrane lipoprotein carrier protein LolA [Gammaproteobacteria bacterium]